MRRARHAVAVGAGVILSVGPCTLEAQEGMPAPPQAVAAPQALPPSELPGPASDAPPDVSRQDGAGPRDPFWPVGWRPPKPEPVVVEVPLPVTSQSRVQWEEAKGMLRVSGLSKDAEGNFFAILKDIGVVEAGDIVSVTIEDLVYKWRIREITQQGIVPEKAGVYPKKTE